MKNERNALQKILAWAALVVALPQAVSAQIAQGFGDRPIGARRTSRPSVYVPHDVSVPGVLTKGDLCDLVATMAPRSVRLEGTVDGWNRTLTRDAVHAAYTSTVKAYQHVAPGVFSIARDRTSPVRWLLDANRQ